MPESMSGAEQKEMSRGEIKELASELNDKKLGKWRGWII